MAPSDNGFSDDDEDRFDDSGAAFLSASKKRKLNRACDTCRRRKQRCDVAERPDNQCSNCQLINSTCTFNEMSTKRAPPKGYVESLEYRVRSLEAFITERLPDADIPTLFGPPLNPAQFANRRRANFPVPSRGLFIPNSGKGDQATLPNRASSVISTSRRPPASENTISSLGANSAVGTPLALLKEETVLTYLSPAPASARPSSATSPSVPTSLAQASSSRAQPATRTSPSPASPPNRQVEDRVIHNFLTVQHKDELLFRRYLGRSSVLSILHVAVGLKYRENGARFNEELKLITGLCRESYWRIPPWETTPRLQLPPRKPHVIGLSDADRAALEQLDPLVSWPADDLAHALIDLYFQHVNVIFPLFHRRTFDQLYASYLYESDLAFARICLLVFAVASSYSDDTRVRSPRTNGGTYGPQSSGWVFYHAFTRLIRHRGAPTQLYDLQVAVLLTQFLNKTSQPCAAAMAVAEGLQFALDIGIHRRGVRRSSDPIENELFRRAFWCLYINDRFGAIVWGRHVSLSEANLDADLPHECDDEFWTPNAQGVSFQQPADQPSRVSVFIHLIRLARLQTSVLSRLYLCRLSWRDQGEAVRELDAELTAWHAAIPPHLHWDVNHPDPISFRQSTFLIVSYHNLRAMIHRPYLPSPEHPISLSNKAFATCVDAANFGSAALHLAFQREKVLALNANMSYVFAMILLVAMWGARETGLVSDPAIAVSGVERCLSILNKFASRHHTINRGIEVIEVLIAPRIDYLAESLTARAERERRIAEANIRAATWSSDDGDFEVRPLIRAVRWNYELDHRGHGGGTPYLHATEQQHHDGHYQHPVSASREQGGSAPFAMPLQPPGSGAPLMGLPWLDNVDFFGAEFDPIAWQSSSESPGSGQLYGSGTPSSASELELVDPMLVMLGLAPPSHEQQQQH